MQLVMINSHDPGTGLVQFRIMNTVELSVSLIMTWMLDSYFERIDNWWLGKIRVLVDKSSSQSKKKIDAYRNFKKLWLLCHQMARLNYWGNANWSGESSLIWLIDYSRDEWNYLRSLKTFVQQIIKRVLRKIQRASNATKKEFKKRKLGGWLNCHYMYFYCSQKKTKFCL